MVANPGHHAADRWEGDVDPVEMQRERDLLAIEGSAQFGYSAASAELQTRMTAMETMGTRACSHARRAPLLVKSVNKAARLMIVGGQAFVCRPEIGADV
jgi:hypothetical protein